MLTTLKSRFEKKSKRHKGIEWVNVLAKLQAKLEKLWSLHEMERTGSEPDVIALDNTEKEYCFCDYSTETPLDRRSLCYHRKGWESRKEHQPKINAVDMATDMGIELLLEKKYQQLQSFGSFDTKTSSWLKTPDDERKNGGSIFGYRRYGHVFVHHNWPQSYYAGRGFRRLLWI